VEALEAQAAELITRGVELLAVRLVLTPILAELGQATVIRWVVVAVVELLPLVEQEVIAGHLLQLGVAVGLVTR
jgi:hypothetical protein